MKLTRKMSIFTNEIEELEEGKTYLVTNNQSWSGGNTKQEFINEWEKDIEVIIFFKNAKKDDFRKLTIDDVDETDVYDCDIELYDEHRANKEIELKIIDFSDGREDVGYIEIEVDYK